MVALTPRGGVRSRDNKALGRQVIPKSLPVHGTKVHIGAPVKKLRAMIVMAAMLVGTLFVSAAPAQAAYTDCAYGLACFWDGPNASGARWTISVSGSGINVCNSFAWSHPEWDDRAWSGITSFGSGLKLYVYTGFQCQGISTSYGPGTVAFQWDPPNVFWRNVSAWKIAN